MSRKYESTTLFQLRCLNFVVVTSLLNPRPKDPRNGCCPRDEIALATPVAFSITRFAIIAVQENSEQSEAKVANEISNPNGGVGEKRESIVVVTIEVQNVCNCRQDAQTRIDEKAKQDNQFKGH